MSARFSPLEIFDDGVPLSTGSSSSSSAASFPSVFGDDGSSASSSDLSPPRRCLLAARAVCCRPCALPCGAVVACVLTALFGAVAFVAWLAARGALPPLIIHPAPPPQLMTAADVQAMDAMRDMNVRACDDFYQHACGALIERQLALAKGASVRACECECH
jgi:hypothetical protein